jgi:hypothetical protein
MYPYKQTGLCLAEVFSRYIIAKPTRRCLARQSALELIKEFGQTAWL